jgi:hypothetical protein
MAVVSLAEVWNGTAWTMQVSPDPEGTASTALSALACPGADACIAVGGYTTATGGATLALAWNGTAWTVMATPNPGGAADSVLFSVSCTARDACTAVGAYAGPAGTEPLVESWNGSSWRIQRAPTVASSLATELTGVSCTAPSACLAVGWYSTDIAQGLMDEVWNGSSWKPSVLPSPSQAVESVLEGVSCSAADDCTAVGFQVGITEVQSSLAERWNGSAWRIGAVPQPKGTLASALFGVWCSSPGSCTAVGGRVNPSQANLPLAEGWNGSAWTTEVDPGPAGAVFSALVAVVCKTPSACSAVGYSDGDTLAQAWNGAAWRDQTSSNPAGQGGSELDGVACSTSTACRAVGYSLTPAGFDSTLAEVRR